MRQLLGEDFGSVPGIGHRCEIAAGGLGPTIQTDKTVFATHLPVVVVDIAAMTDVSEQAFGSGTITRSPLWYARYRNKGLDPREDEGVFRVIVDEYALGCLAAYPG